MSTIIQRISEFMNAIAPAHGTAPGVLTELSLNANALYIRKDDGNIKNRINVYDNKGHQLYRIERKDRFAGRWVITNTQKETTVAIVTIGLLNKFVDFTNKPGLRHRVLKSRPNGYEFYLNDGALYVWTPTTQLLERVINPGGKDEETRQRIAGARLMRPKKFDWELLVQKDFDLDIALATSLVSLLTRWSTRQSVIPGGRTALKDQE